MSKSARVRREKRLEAALGYLMLEMSGHALRELNAIDDPERCPFEYNKLRGEALKLQGQYEAALEAYARAHEDDPTDLTVSLGMGWCFKRVDQLPKAIAVLQEAYRWSSEEAIVLYNLACYYALAGDKNQALMWLGRSLRMDGSLRKLIPDERDFDRFRDDPDFQMVTRSAEDIRKGL